MLNSTNTFHESINERLIEVIKWFVYVGLEPKIGEASGISYLWAQIEKKDGLKINIYIDKIDDKWKIKAQSYKWADYFTFPDEKPIQEWDETTKFNNLGELKEMINKIGPEITDGLLKLSNN